jgi:sugar phosphate isomerase/epimerase
MRFGISTHLYHDARLDRDHLVEIAAHGFELVEVFATRPHFDYHDPAAVDAVVEHARDAGLEVHSVHAPIAESLRGGVWGAPYSIAQSREERRRQAVDEVVAAATSAARLGARYLVVHVGVPDELAAEPEDNRLGAAVRSLETIQQVTAPLGVALALEVIPNTISSAERLVAWLEDDVDLPGAGICLDSGHAFLMGDLVDAIETASGHLLTTHLHDNHGRADDHLVPFEGSIDWPVALTALQKIGYEGAWMFELAASDEPRRVLERAVRARERFEQVLGGVL